VSQKDSVYRAEREKQHSQAGRRSALVQLQPDGRAPNSHSFTFTQNSVIGILLSFCMLFVEFIMPKNSAFVTI
jgi:hypothetical protein